MPLTLAILLGLFLMQSRGTEKIGKLFGPIMVLWFVVLAVLGAIAILKSPQILRAANPMYGVALFAREPWTAFVALGSVVLAVTGCEALYADMGHFGARAIRWAWLYFALPALMLNYFGQGALLLSHPADASFLFYAMVPHWAHYPMVVLAAMATIIASQAVISGVFSITRQAVQLGQLPRMEIRHTSATEQGQIYVPRINVLLCVGVVLIVLIFKSSAALAAAYGIAVTGVMVISTVLVGMVAIYRWKWKRPAVYAVFGLLGLIDLTFLASNSLKIVQGGWLPLAVAAAVFVVMDTWRVGRRLHLEKMRDNSLALDLFLARAEKYSQRVSGTAVFMSPRSDIAPNAMLHSLKHYKVLHERVVLGDRHRGRYAFCAHVTACLGGETGQRLFLGPLSLWFFRYSQLAGCFPGGARPGIVAGHGHGHLLPGPRNAGAGRSSQPAALAGGALHVAGVERPVAGAVLPTAAWPRGRTRHATHNLVERVNQSFEIRTFRQHRMHRMVRSCAGAADQRRLAATAHDARRRIRRQSGRWEYCASRRPAAMCRPAR